MKLINRVLLLFLSTAFFAHISLQSKEIHTIEHIEILMDALHAKQPTIIMGFMNNCPHCKTIEPFFKKQLLQFPHITFIRVNGPQLGLHKLVNEEQGQYKIIGYPCFVFVKDNKIQNVILGGRENALLQALQEFSS